MDYNGERTLEGLSQFIESGGSKVFGEAAEEVCQRIIFDRKRRIVTFELNNNKLQ